jgi:tRNA (guanine-N(7)-)-methyltransferase subunit TRM82
MPKRPCALDLTSDNQTILIADKFGDVYSMPLFPKKAAEDLAAEPTVKEEQEGCDTTSGASTPAETPKFFKSEANEFTVHSKRNLRALQHQNTTKLQPAAPKPAAAIFEHRLLLGHVSMLTAIAFATSANRPYILTADRDEHIRVSRCVLDQAHVIENYCLGHKDFISRLCLLPGAPDLLVSGGGDDEVFLWEWVAGRVLAKVDLLSRVQEVNPGAENVAVSKLFAHATGSGSGYSLFVLCER